MGEYLVLSMRDALENCDELDQRAPDNNLIYFIEKATHRDVPGSSSRPSVH